MVSGRWLRTGYPTGNATMVVKWAECEECGESWRKMTDG